MQYRIIPSAEFHSLPEHFKILKNFQEMHASLLNLGDEGLIEIVPNYEGKFNSLAVNVNRMISKNKINSIIHKIGIDLTIKSLNQESRIRRKNYLISTLEKTIEKYQGICDEIDRIEEEKEYE